MREGAEADRMLNYVHMVFTLQVARGYEGKFRLRLGADASTARGAALGAGYRWAALIRSLRCCPQESTYTKPAELGGTGQAAAASATGSTAASGVWKEVKDASGKPYYWNTKTNVRGVCVVAP